MAAEPMPDELTDEKLAEIYDRAYWDTNAWIDDPIIEGVRAVRAALCPPVTPLAPGETVTIPDRWWLPTDTVYAGLILNESECYPDLSVSADDGEVGVRVRLNAAGVAQLERACQRWRAAQNETESVRTSLESAIGAEKA